jgi:hypothetical protein
MSELIRPGVKYVTRDSRSPVRILCIDAEREEYPIVGLIDGIPHTWTAEGVFFLGDTSTHGMDLVPAAQVPR